MTYYIDWQDNNTEGICPDCGEKVGDGEWINITVNGMEYPLTCPHCHNGLTDGDKNDNDELGECSCCGSEVFARFLSEHNGRYLCRDCMSMHECYGCGYRSAFDEDFYELDDGYLCISCYYAQYGDRPE